MTSNGRGGGECKALIHDALSLGYNLIEAILFDVSILYNHMFKTDPSFSGISKFHLFVRSGVNNVNNYCFSWLCWVVFLCFF